VQLTLEAVETAVAAVAAQGDFSRDAGTGYCLYRHPDGSRCFVGHLVPNDRYDPSMEGETFFQLAYTFKVWGEVDSNLAVLVSVLQNLHDNLVATHSDIDTWLPLATKRVNVYRPLLTQ